MLGAFLGLCAGLVNNSCGPKGLDVEICVLDAPKLQFACAKGEGPSRLLKFEEGKDLICISPQDTEKVLKSCKNHTIISIPLCSVSTGGLICSDGSSRSWDQSDNYACLHQKDYGRMLERCKL